MGDRSDTGGATDAVWKRILIRKGRIHLFPLIPFLFYGYTCSTKIAFGDTAMHVSNIHYRGFSTHVNDHPMMILWGWLFSFLPFGDPAYKAHLVSVFFGALAISVFYFSILSLHGSRLVAAVTASFLMVCHSMWWHSTIIEPYAFTALFTVIALGLFVRLSKSSGRHEQQKSLCWLFFLSGLAMLAHVQMAFLALGAAASLITMMILSPRDAWKLFLRASKYYVFGFLPWMALFVKDWMRWGNWWKTVQMAFVGDFAHVMMRDSFSHAASDMALLTVVAYPSPVLICVLMGVLLLVRGWKSAPVPAIGLAAFFSVTTGFFMFYNTWDKFAFLLPSWCILAFAASFSIHWVVHRIQLTSGRRKMLMTTSAIGAYLLSLALPVYIYGHMAKWGASAPSRIRRYDQPGELYRQGTFWWNPNKRHYTDVDDYANLLLAKLPQNAIVIDDAGRTFHTLTLYYQDLLARRHDLTVIQFNYEGLANWGYSADDLNSIIAGAYRTHRDLFMGDGSPYSLVLSRLPLELKMRFERFPLDGSRHLLRLVVRRQAEGLEKTSEVSGDPRIAMGAPPFIHELQKEDVSFSLNVNDVVQQRMDRFGGLWRSNDQLMVVAYRDLGEVSIVLSSPERMIGNLEVGYTTSFDYGNVTLMLDHTPAGGMVDLYSPDMSTATQTYAGVVLGPGENVVTFRVQGKRRASHGYSFGLDWIGFHRAGEEEGGVKGIGGENPGRP